VVLRDGRPSTLLRKLNAGGVAGAAAEFARWNRGGGLVLPGLVKRRAAEVALFQRR
jgi:GH24 family phage-related lysozyme (muramidase)